MALTKTQTEAVNEWKRHLMDARARWNPSEPHTLDELAQRVADCSGCPLADITALFKQQARANRAYYRKAGMYKGLTG